MIAVYNVGVRLPHFGLGRWMQFADACRWAGADMLMFWVSGTLPNPRFPSSDVYAVRHLTGAMTDDDLRDLIRYCHGIGMELHLLSSVFGWDGIQEMVLADCPELQAHGEDLPPGWMCVSHPRSQALMKDYLLDFARRFPEADGMVLEIGCECGHCQCASCRGRQGQLELEFLRDFAATLWQTRAHMTIGWMIGYTSHRDDPAYYEAIGRISDKRIWFYNARVRNDYVDATGTVRRFADPSVFRSISPRQLVFTNSRTGGLTQSDLDDIRQGCRQCDELGAAGMMVGVHLELSLLPVGHPFTHCWYSYVPYPDAFDPMGYLSIRMSLFALRQFRNEPDLPAEEFRRCLHAEFLGTDAPSGLTDDLVRYKTLHARNPWNPPVNTFKDALWARSAGTWSMYFGYTDFHEAYPERMSRIEHPVEMLDQWDRPEDVPDAWLALWWRLRRARAEHLPWLDAAQGRLADAVAKLPPGSASIEKARTVLEHYRIVRRNVLLVSDDEDANRRFDRFMDEALRARPDLGEKELGWPAYVPPSLQQATRDVLFRD